MAEVFGVTPDGLRATSRDLEDRSSEMKAVVRGLRENLAAIGPAWGDDELGRAFCEGEDGNGYLAQLQWACDSADPVKTGLLDFYAELLTAMADSAERNERF